MFVLSYSLETLAVSVKLHVNAGDALKLAEAYNLKATTNISKVLVFLAQP